MSKLRATSLDAFRGYAILTMVLSGSIAWGVLPGWMYHAQVGPRSNFVFDGSVYGITWVDLVFPFFLFAMGAAFPFSIGSKIRNGISRWRIVYDGVLRGIRLTFFAIFIQHIYPWSVSSPQDTRSWLIALAGFVLMFPMFMRIPLKMPDYLRLAIKVIAYSIGIVMLLNIHYANERVFSPGYSNIIILVLANMAIFGSIIYAFTINHPWVRIAILPFVAAILLGSEHAESWNHALMNYSPLPWMYQFAYLKYLFIVLPGSIAGEYLYEWLHNRTATEQSSSQDERKRMPWILLLTIGVIVFNLYGLYTRHLLINLAGTVFLLGVLYILLQVEGKNTNYWRKLYKAGTYLILLGLFFEAYEGGIRKDPSTYSYYLLASGLAFMAMIAFSIMCDVYSWNKLTRPLEYAGQNPMIAYVSTQLVALPLINLAGLGTCLTYFDQNPWLGFLKGVIITSMALLITILFTKLKCFWRT
ncbi:DUF5009 domain-containing protein [Bacteroides reticulotermitis]|uniref:DUF5009 domain-containing protein n=2 Tax=Bacteroides reticulotermitis TaxID=1133319 RepID=W4UZI8_9BACE|nr:DUF5009 domain-containing protein [Bacteroides reticulotermitis]MBB4046236.1 putative acyltransferase [Bacteroides reticulotermitis]GAE86252.1 hypothetical protein JCM10512_4749 [Bacteroides reticulotermitis JCM 10512]